MATSEIAKRYFAALDAHDLDAAVALLGSRAAIDRFVGQQELVAPDGVREYFAELFAAFPDFSLRDPRADHRARNRTRGALAGARAPSPARARSRASSPTARAIEIEGCDVVTVADELIEHNDAYVDSADIARQLGFLPPAGSPAEARLTKLANLRTRLRTRAPRRARRADRRRRVARPRRPPADDERLPDRGRGRRHRVRRRDRGHDRRAWPPPARGWAASSASCSATPTPTTAAPPPGLGAPVYCHRSSARPPSPTRPFRAYWDLEQASRLRARRLPPAAPALGRRRGRRSPARCSEGDEIAGFRVIDLPGPRARADRAVPRVRPARPRLRLLLHARPADRPQGRRRSVPAPGLQPATPSRPAPRSASSPRSTRRSSGPGHADRSPATWPAQLERRRGRLTAWARPQPPARADAPPTGSPRRPATTATPRATCSRCAAR